MSSDRETMRLRVTIELAQFDQRDQTAMLVRNYSADLFADLFSDLGLPDCIAPDIEYSDAKAFDHGAFFRVVIDGEECRCRWWPQPEFPKLPNSRDRAAVLNLTLYDSREFLVSSGLAHSIALDWKVADDSGYRRGWSAEGFLRYLRAFPRSNFSLRHGRKTAEEFGPGANSESGLAYLFERAIEASAKESEIDAFGIGLEVCEELYGEIIGDGTESFVSSITKFTTKLTDRLGLVCPKPDVQHTPLLGAGEFQIRLNDIHLPEIPGVEAADPGTGSGVDYVQNWLQRAIERNAGSFLATPLLYLLCVRTLLKTKDDELYHPNLLDDVTTRCGNSPPILHRLSAVLRRLLEERVSILNIAGILESILSLREVTKNGCERRIYQFSRPQGPPVLVAEGRTFEELTIDDCAFAARVGARLTGFADSLTGRQPVPLLWLTDETQLPKAAERRSRERILELLRTQPSPEIAVVVPAGLRTAIRDLIRFEFPTVTVLASCELPNAFLGLAYYSLGRVLLNGREYVKAIKTYREAACLTPEDAICHAYLAYSLTSQGGYTNVEERKDECYREAVEEYRRSIKRDPETAWFHHYLSVPLKRLGLWDEAAKGLTEAIAMDPENSDAGQKSDARRELADCLRRLGRIDEALSELAKSTGTQADLAAHYIQKGDYIKAAEAAKKDVKSAALLPFLDKLVGESQDARRHGELGQRLIELGNWQDAAAAEFRRATGLDPQNSAFHISLGNTLYRLEDWPGAAEEWEDVVNLKRGEDPLTWNNLGTAYDALKQFDKAVDCYREAASRSDSFVPQFNLARSNYVMKKYDKARDCCIESIKRDEEGKFAPAHFHLGNCLHRLGQTNEAIEEWKKTLNLSSGDVEALCNLAVAYWQAGGGDAEATKKALDCWKEALRNDPNLTAAEEAREAVERGESPQRLDFFDWEHRR